MNPSADYRDARHAPTLEPDRVARSPRNLGYHFVARAAGRSGKFLKSPQAAPLAGEVLREIQLDSLLALGGPPLSPSSPPWVPRPLAQAQAEPKPGNR
jgi:hypothetical protein